MAVEWREFEHLVARIEQTLAPQGAVVMSPDRAKALDALTQVRALVGSKLVAVGAGPSPKDVLDAIHAGADDYLDAADEFDAELEALLKRVRSARCAPAWRPTSRSSTPRRSHP